MAEDKNKVEITKEEYIHFQRLEEFVSNFTNGYVVCKKCGAYIGEGYRCFECGHDPSYDQYGKYYCSTTYERGRNIRYIKLKKRGRNAPLIFCLLVCSMLLQILYQTMIKISKIKFVSARFGTIFAIYIDKHIRYETTIEIN